MSDQIEIISLMLKILSRREGEKHQLKELADSLQIKMKVDSNLKRDNKKINTLTSKAMSITTIDNMMTIM